MALVPICMITCNVSFQNTHFCLAPGSSMSARRSLSMLNMRASMFSQLIDVGQPLSIAVGKVTDSNLWRWQTEANASSGAIKPKGLEGLGLFRDRILACAIIFRSRGDGLGGRQLSQKGQRLLTAPRQKIGKLLFKGYID